MKEIGGLGEILYRRIRMLFIDYEEYIKITIENFDFRMHNDFLREGKFSIKTQERGRLMDALLSELKKIKLESPRFKSFSDLNDDNNLSKVSENSDLLYIKEWGLYSLLELQLDVERFCYDGNLRQLSILRSMIDSVLYDIRGLEQVDRKYFDVLLEWKTEYERDEFRFLEISTFFDRIEEVNSFDKFHKIAADYQEYQRGQEIKLNRLKAVLDFDKAFLAGFELQLKHDIELGHFVVQFNEFDVVNYNNLIFTSFRAWRIFNNTIALHSKKAKISNDLYGYLFHQMKADGYIISSLKQEDFKKYVDEEHNYPMSRARELSEIVKKEIYAQSYYEAEKLSLKVD